MKRIGILLILFVFISQACAPRVTVRNRGRVVVVKKAPRNYKVVVVKNKRYYTWGGNYYRRTSNGYVLVRI